MEEVNKLGKILIVDDNEDVLFALNLLLEPYTEKIKVATTPDRIEHFMTTFHPDLILLDMNFSRDAISGQEGFESLKQILQLDPQAIVIFMTAYADTDKAVRAIKAGATDFIPKPWEKDKLLATLTSGMRLRQSQQEVNMLKEQVEILSGQNASENDIIGESPAMQEVFATINKLSNTDANILILGENGTGKDVIARLLYRCSPRYGKPFVTIDLGSIPEQLFESELFGFEKGAFTDAKKSKAGRMEVATNGTLFLDEIGNLSLPMQSKLLTAIEKRQISRLGSTQTIPIDVRLICATNTSTRQQCYGNSPTKKQGYWGPTNEYVELVGDDPRADAIFSKVDSLMDSRSSAVAYNLKSVKKLLNDANDMPVIFSRVSELYLIKAEALYRSGASISEAYAPIRKLRERAGAEIILPANNEELETAIFNEWKLELSFENWHEWFAMIRFAGYTEKPDFTRLLALNKTLREALEKEYEKSEAQGDNYYQRIIDRRIDAIPSSEISSNLECKQNPGY